MIPEEIQKACKRENITLEHLQVRNANPLEFLRVLYAFMHFITQKTPNKDFQIRLYFSDPINPSSYYFGLDSCYYLKQKITSCLHNIIQLYDPHISKKTEDPLNTPMYFYLNDTLFYKQFPTARERLDNYVWLQKTLEKRGILSNYFEYILNKISTIS